MWAFGAGLAISLLRYGFLTLWRTGEEWLVPPLPGSLHKIWRDNGPWGLRRTGHEGPWRTGHEGPCRTVHEGPQQAHPPGSATPPSRVSGPRCRVGVLPSACAHHRMRTWRMGGCHGAQVGVKVSHHWRKAPLSPLTEGRRGLHVGRCRFLVAIPFLAFCNSLLFPIFLCYSLLFSLIVNKSELSFWLPAFDLLCVWSLWLFDPSSLTLPLCSRLRTHIQIRTHISARCREKTVLCG